MNAEVCQFCGTETDMVTCDECYADRKCDICSEYFDERSPKMHYDGPSDTSLVRCHEYWLDEQPVLVQLANCGVPNESV